MLCLECGAEMGLIQVTKDTTRLVSGFEHHTWRCSGCSTVEQRITFTREKTPTQIVPVEPAQTGLVEPTETAQPTEAIPVEPIQVVSVGSTQTVLEPTKTTLVRPIQIDPPQPTPLAAMPKMNARAKALDEKLRNLKER